MIRSFINFIKGRVINDESAETRRNYVRRQHDRCVCFVNGQIFPVLDWSPGGTLLNGDERTFRVGDEVNVEMKFRVGEDVVELAHRGRIVRKAREKVALQFAPLNESILRGFQRVIDDYAASEFAGSQVV